MKPLPAVDVLSYLITSEKENLRTERKQNYLIKNEKEKKYSDYYYLSNGKVIEVVCSSRISLLAFYSSEKVLSAQVCSLASVSSPHVRESGAVLDSGFHAVDSGFRVLDSGFQKELDSTFFPVLMLSFALRFRVRILL